MPNDELYSVPRADNLVSETVVIVEETVWKETRLSRRWGVRKGRVRLKDTTTPVPSGRMLVKVNMTLYDDEDFSADEDVSHYRTGWADLDQELPRIVNVEGRCGGEMRLEIEFQGILNLRNPNLLELAVTALLFEGASDSNTDLDGQFLSNLLVKRGETVVVSGVIFSKEGDQGDMEDNDWGAFHALVSFE